MSRLQERSFQKRKNIITVVQTLRKSEEEKWKPPEYIIRVCLFIFKDFFIL